jgi:hypothetical protein
MRIAEVCLPGGYRLPRWVYDGIYEYQRHTLHWYVDATRVFRCASAC